MIPIRASEKMVHSVIGRLLGGAKRFVKIVFLVVDDPRPMRKISLSLSREVDREANVLGGIFYSELGYQTPA